MGAERKPKFGALLISDSVNFSANEDNGGSNQKGSPVAISPRYASPRYSNSSTETPPDGEALSPNYPLSPTWYQSSPYMKSPWIITSPVIHNFCNYTDLIGSIAREDGHVYSLAAAGDLLYTGSDSKNIRVWKNMKELTGFKSNSGLVKAIIIHGDKIFTGHQDGKIRVWKVSAKNPSVYKRIGSLPTFKDYVKSSVNPNNYVEVRRRRNVLRIKHYDAVSCMSLNVEQGLLYSGSWDKTLKVWRITDYKCLESFQAHDDAINSVVCGFGSLVFTGSADGTLKVWRRELQEKGTKHFLEQTLLKQENAVTALAVNDESSVIYSGSSDGLVNFWEREKQLTNGGILRGHKMAVLCLASAGNLVFTGSADKTICVWKRESGGVHLCLSVLTGHNGPVKCLAVDQDQESDGKDQRWILYSGSLDRSVKVWRVAENLPVSKEHQSPRLGYSSPPRPQKGKSRSEMEFLEAF